MIRFFDILFSLMGLILLSPLLVIVYAFIVLESKGGGFYEQKRVGLNGIEFKLYKFRSMVVGSDKKGLITIGGNDSRITKTGLFVRKFKIDELPQLYNVLIGDMSLVGPRPEVRKYVDLYTKEQNRIFNVKPGITDWASIIYSNENDILEKSDNPEQTYIQQIIPDKIKYNLIFINNYGTYEYFRIIICTLLKIINSNIDFDVKRT